MVEQAPFSPLGEESWVTTPLTSDDDEEMTDYFNHIKQTTTISTLLNEMVKRVANNERNDSRKLQYVYEIIKSAVTGRIQASHVQIADEIDAMYPDYHRVYEIADEKKRKEELFNVLQDEHLEVITLESIYEEIKKKTQTKTTNTTQQQRTYATVAESTKTHKDNEKKTETEDQRRKLEYTFFKLPDATRDDVINALVAKFNLTGTSLLHAVQQDTRYRNRWVITFSKEQFKTKLINEGITIKDTRIKGKIERMKERRRQERVRLYIPNLPFLCDDASLEKFFEPHQVMGVTRRTDQNGIAIGGTTINIVKAIGKMIPTRFMMDYESFDVYYPGSRPRRNMDPAPETKKTPAETSAEETPSAEESTSQVTVEGDTEGETEVIEIAVEDTPTPPQIPVEGGEDQQQPMEITPTPNVTGSGTEEASFNIMVTNHGAKEDSLRRALKRKAKSIKTSINAHRVSESEMKVAFKSDSSRHEFIKLLVDGPHVSKIGESSFFVISEAPGLDRKLWSDYKEVTSTIRKKDAKVTSTKRKLSTGETDGAGGEKVVKSSD